MSKEYNLVVNITNKTNNGDIIWNYMSDRNSYMTSKIIDDDKILEMWYDPDEVTISINNETIDISGLDYEYVSNDLDEAITLQIYNRDNADQIASQEQKDREYDQLLDIGLSW